MTGDENRRETGATKYPVMKDADPSDVFSQDAAGNKKPPSGIGLRRPAGQGEESPSARRKPGKQATPSPATEKTSGAGPAIAERSKDAKAPKAGRQAGAYVKE